MAGTNSGATGGIGATNGTGATGGTHQNGGTGGEVVAAGGSSAGEGGEGGGGAGEHSEGGTAGVGGIPNGTAGGGSGAGGGDDAGAGGSSESSLSLTNFAIDPNPNMTISCFVSWTTAEPASSEVDFGEGTYAFRIRDATPVTDHHVLVIGMHAETKYQIKAISSTGAALGQTEGVFTTGALPEDLPLPMVTVDQPSKGEVGWTLANVSVLNRDPAFIVMYDETGLPVWYFVNGTHVDDRGDIATAYDRGRVLVGPAPGEPVREVDLSGAVQWEGPAQGAPAGETHEFKKTSGGNYLINTDLWTNVGGVQKIDGFAQEIKPDWSEVWSWHFFDHFASDNAPIDACHGNAMTFDEPNDIFYYNCRFLGLIKIDRVTGDVVWRLGGSYDRTTYGPGDFTFVPPESQFSDTHDPELHDDGTVLVFDNGGWGNNTTRYHSRVVEYQLDEAAKTASRTFEFPGEFDVDPWYTDQWYTNIFGDADRLENGNILITAFTAIFEVTRSGEVVWRLDHSSGVSYRAQRLSPPPLVESLP